MKPTGSVIPAPINPAVAAMGEFPFRRLAALLANEPAPDVEGGTLDLGIGEPQMQPPPLLAETVAANGHLWNRYPPANGTADYRQAAASWLERRFGLPGGWLDPDRHVLPLAGTKEGIFLLAQLAVARTGEGGRRPAVLMPDPLYAVYLGAAVMAGAEPVPLPCTAGTGFLPDLDALDPGLLARTSLFYLCNPANPQGAVASKAYLRRCLQLAREFGFLLALDECYSEIYDREAPVGGLEAALDEGQGLANLVVLHSLSKRSGAAGLRSGFVAGDPDVLAWFLKLRAFGAAVQPLPLIAAGAALWRDEAHVAANRLAYRRKIDLAEERLGGRLGFYRPSGGFFLWLNVGDGVKAASRLWRLAGVRALPGAFLSVPPEPNLPSRARPNPASPYLRLALVHEDGVVARALDRVAETLA